MIRDLHAVFLDLDDTILDIEQHFKKGLERVFRILSQRYPSLTWEVFLDTFEKSRNEIKIEHVGKATSHHRLFYFQRLLEKLGIPLQPGILMEMYQIYWDTVVKYMSIVPGFEKALHIMKDLNIKVGIITNLTADVQFLKLRYSGIDTSLIDFIITSEEAGVEKPHPAIYLLATTKAHSRPDNSLFVDDNLTNLQGAKRLGFHVALMDIHGKHKSVPSWVDLHVHDFNELLTAIGLKSPETGNDRILFTDIMGTLFKERSFLEDLVIPAILSGVIEVRTKKLKEYIELVRKEYYLAFLGRRNVRDLIPEKEEREILKRATLNRELVNVLRELKSKGIKLGILSNMPREWAQWLLEFHALQDMFDIVITSGELGYLKPSDELYRHVLDCLLRMKISPSNVYVLDDRLANLKAGRFFRMKTIWWNPTGTPPREFIPDYIVREPRDLLRIVF